MGGLIVKEEKGFEEKWYTSLIKDESFTNLNWLKVRRLIGLALAETLGTAFFIFIGCANVVNTIKGSDTTHLNTAIAFAFGIGASIALFGHVSGAVMNPGLNFALLILGHFSIYKVIFYTIFQLVGSLLAMALLWMVTPNLPGNFCVVHPNPDIGLARGMLAEFIIMLILTFGLCAVVDPVKKPYADGGYMKFAIIILAIAIPVAKYAGGCMNPARAFGPAVFSNSWEHHWVYWLVPIVGACFGAVVYLAFFHSSVHANPPPKENLQKQV